MNFLKSSNFKAPSLSKPTPSPNPDFQTFLAAWQEELVWHILATTFVGLWVFIGVKKNYFGKVESDFGPCCWSFFILWSIQFKVPAWLPHRQTHSLLFASICNCKWRKINAIIPYCENRCCSQSQKLTSVGCRFICGVRTRPLRLRSLWPKFPVKLFQGAAKTLLWKKL